VVEVEWIWVKRRLMLLVFALGIVLAVVSAGLWVSGQFGVNHIPIAFRVGGRDDGLHAPDRPQCRRMAAGVGRGAH
jgi:hypothetical protein